jgi:ATP-dependent DNA ligase
MRPMLAETATMADLPKLLTDDKWVAQLKADGHRYLIVIENGKMSVLNRAGQPKVSMVDAAIAAQFAVFTTGTWIFDGEIVGNQLLLFDLAQAGAEIATTNPFTERYQVLSVLYNDVWQPDPNLVALLPVAAGETAKRALLAQAERECKEGIMMRHVDGTYQPGRRSRQLLKVKFTKTVDAIILRTGDGGKENVTLALLDPINNRIVEIGRASAIGKKPAPTMGQVWEIEYLYVVDPKAPRLYQPRLKMLRTDKELHECLFNQLDGCYTDKSVNLEKDRTAP